MLANAAFVAYARPLETSELATAYWTTARTAADIMVQFGIRAVSKVSKEAGAATLEGVKCVHCDKDVTVSCRGDAIHEIGYFESGLPYKRSKISCKPCYRADQDRRSRERFIQWRVEDAGYAERSAELAAMPYAEYLKSEEWKNTRNDALKRAGFRCQTCAEGGQMHVHHRTYIRRGQERPTDLIVLCADCHSLFHSNRKLADGGRAA